MTLTELNRYFNSFLHKEDYDSDISLNGIQISNSAPDEKPITKVAFAVDACEATALKAAQAGAQVLFVHHGLFWGHCQTITGSHYKRIAAFIKNDLALVAYHIPLDANEFVGNNFGIARRLGLEKIRPFGKWRGMTLGASGELPQPCTIEELAKILFPNGEEPSHILPFGKESIKKVAIISGGAGDDFEQAVKIGADAYITGEVGHKEFHSIKEAGINVIAGGHYNTETVGVQLVQKRLEEDKGLETVFIDIPTGM
ncbi:MAG: Nif3-like dinuclear metal center hexameric protein [Treponema sp.]|nr:Nif3-like dinuclear metal center hexameric protein [Treponema sp.]